jgi:hypothetical protein
MVAPRCRSSSEDRMNRLVLVAGVLVASVACGIGDAGFTAGAGTEGGYISGAPALALSVEEIWLAEVGDGQTVSDDLLVRNDGDADLKLYSASVIDDGGGAFYADEQEGSDVTLAPGDEVEVTVVCTMSGDARVDGVLRLDSNDPTRPTLDVPLICSPIGWVEDTGA